MHYIYVNFNVQQLTSNLVYLKAHTVLVFAPGINKRRIFFKKQLTLKMSLSRLSEDMFENEQCAWEVITWNLKGMLYYGSLPINLSSKNYQSHQFKLVTLPGLILYIILYIVQTILSWLFWRQPKSQLTLLIQCKLNSVIVYNFNRKWPTKVK